MTERLPNSIVLFGIGVMALLGCFGTANRVAARPMKDLAAQGHNTACFTSRSGDDWTTPADNWKDCTVLIPSRCRDEYPMAWCDGALRWQPDHRRWTSVQRELLSKAHEVATQATPLPVSLEQVYSDVYEINGRIFFELLPLDVETRIKAEVADAHASGMMVVDDSVFSTVVSCERNGTCKLESRGTW